MRRSVLHCRTWNHWSASLPGQSQTQEGAHAYFRMKRRAISPNVKWSDLRPGAENEQSIGATARA